MTLLTIRNLTVRFATATGSFTAVDGIDVSVDKGEVLAIVGESGSGKSVSMLAVMGLLADTATITADEMRFDGRDLLKLTPQERRAIIGREITMIFQEPIASLNPSFTVGFQIEEVLRLNLGMSRAAARARALELFRAVGIPEPETKLNAYPHQMSGGQCQRVMIAMALAGRPDLLIADEPTTALDATIQAQILDLLSAIRRETGMAMVFISHDLGAVSAVCDRAAVMYAGRIVETNDVARLFAAPKHPYTRGLFDAIPELDAGRARLVPIEGTVPDPRNPPQGCAFSPRCARATGFCRSFLPELKPQLSGGHVACFYHGHASMPEPKPQEVVA